MTMEHSQLQINSFFGKISQKDQTDGQIQQTDHTPVKRANQPGSSQTASRRAEKENRNYRDQRGKFERILHKAKTLEVPGGDHLQAYLWSQCRRNLRISTIENAYSTISVFLILLAHEGKKYLQRITRHDIEAYIEQEQDKGLKASTVRQRLDVLKAFIRYLIENQIVSSDILYKRMIIKVPQSLPKAIEIEDEKRLLSVIDNVRNRAMILLLLRTGMRIGELLSTQPQDIDLKEQSIRIWEAQKSRIGRMVYFTTDAKKALASWYKRRDPEQIYIFYGQGHKQLTYGAARAMFCKYLSKANLTDKGYTIHCLRHTNASSLLNAGMPLECVKELLGHTSVEVTRRYARLTNKTREKEYFKAMEKIEKGETDGYYKLDLELQKIIEEKKLLTSDGEKLHE